MRILKVLDLFSGLGGFSKAFIERAHEVTTIDMDPRFGADIQTDVMELTASALPGPFDIVLASPPCNCFSIASKHIHWRRGENGLMVPQGRRVRKAIPLIHHTIELIRELAPTFWALENPRGMARRVLGEPTIKTYFCAWGTFNKKPTDLWGELPENINWPEPRVWEKSPRGAKNAGTNAIADPAVKALIPWALSFTLCVAFERAFEERDSRRIKQYYKTKRPSALCAGCGVLLPQGHRINQRYCGPACRSRAYRERERAVVPGV